MDARYLLLVAHVSLIFTGVTVAWGPSLLSRAAYQTGQVAPVRAVGAIAVGLGRYIPILYMSGGLFGLLTAIAFGHDLLAPWLVIAYVLFAIATVTGIRWTGPWIERIAETAAAAPDGPIPAPLRDLFDSRASVALTIFDLALVFLLVFDMVVKPFS